MNRIIVIIAAILCVSCKIYDRESFTYYHNDEKQLWINAYKYEVFYGCINQGLKNDSLRIILKNKDLFNPLNDFMFSFADEARGLGKNIILKLPKPFIKIDVGEESLRYKNFISYTCLKYYASKELDSIARSEYKKYHSLH